MAEQPDFKALAVHFKFKHPDAYEVVTGLPVWCDQVGPEYRAAEAKWLRYVIKNVSKTN